MDSIRSNGHALGRIVDVFFRRPLPRAGGRRGKIASVRPELRAEERSNHEKGKKPGDAGA
jgi:hypothetical protein